MHHDVHHDVLFSNSLSHLHGIRIILDHFLHEWLLQYASNHHVLIEIQAIKITRIKIIMK